MSGWASAISPHEPPVPKDWHWGAGLVASVLLLGGLATLTVRGTAGGEMVPEAAPVLVTLGSGAQRLEAPPPAPPDAPVRPDTGPVAERAADAPPVSPPPQPRAVPQWTQGTGGELSSGTGAGGGDGLAPPAPPPPPPPRPAAPRTATVSAKYVRFSNALYASLINYPAEAIRLELQGSGTLRITVARDGRVLRWVLTKSTGHKVLDREIERVATEVKRVDPLPDEFTGESAWVDIRITFIGEYAEE